jgi:hypothetical protein
MDIIKCLKLLLMEASVLPFSMWSHLYASLSSNEGSFFLMMTKFVEKYDVMWREQILNGATFKKF